VIRAAIALVTVCPLALLLTSWHTIDGLSGCSSVLSQPGNVAHISQQFSNCGLLGGRPRQKSGWKRWSFAACGARRRIQGIFQGVWKAGKGGR